MNFLSDILVKAGLVVEGSTKVATTTGGLIVGGTVDAGFKADIVGTARVQNRLTITHDIYFSNYATTGITITGPNVVYPLIVIGSNNTTSGNTNIIVGQSNQGTGAAYIYGSSNIGNSNGSIIVGQGNQANTSGQFTVLIGGSNTTSHGVNTFTGMFAIGNSNVLAHQASSIMGSNQTTTANNQLIFASSQSNVNSAGFNDIYFGTGPRSKNSNLLGSNITINGSGAGSGTDLSGGNVTIAGGKGTGAGTPGDVFISTASAAASGTTLQSLTQRVRVVATTGNMVVGSTTDFPQSRLQVYNSTSSASSSIYGGFAATTVTYAASSSLSGSVVVNGFQGSVNYNFGGNVSIPNSVVTASLIAVSGFKFTGSGTVTSSQSGTGIRSMSNIFGMWTHDSSFSGTVTHVANLRLVAPYSGSAGTVTITNYYGIIIEDSSQFSPFSITNKWGIYQEGPGDNNYFAGKVLIGSTADDGSGARLQITGGFSSTSATFSSSVTVSGSAYFGTFNGSTKYYFEPFSNVAGGANNAYLVSGKTDNNERSGFIFQARNGNGEEYNAVAFLGYTGTGTGTALLLDGSGNLGLGVTPSAWDGTLVKAIQLADNGASLSSFSTGNTSSKFAILSNNAYYDSGGWKYLQSAASAQYRIANQEHQWYTAGSGTAGNAITFTQAMTLDASGRLGIGTSSPAERLHVTGAIVSTGGITGHGANRTTISHEGAANGAYWSSHGNDAVTNGKFALRQYVSDGSSFVIPLQIDENSYVGIGTSGSISEKLEVQDGYLGMYWDSGIAESGNGIVFYTKPGGTKRSIAAIISAQNGTTRKGKLYFQVADDATPQTQMVLGSDGALSVGTVNPNDSSMLQVDSTTKGFLPPRMTAAQKTAIASPAAGLIIYQTDGTKGLYLYDGSSWRALTMV